MEMLILLPKGVDMKSIFFQLNNGRLLMQLWGKFGVNDAVDSSDGDELGVKARCKNAGRNIAACACHGFAAQGAIDMDVAIGNYFGAAADHAHDD